MWLTSKPSSLPLAHLATGKRFASLPHRLLATTNGLVIALALSLLPPIDAVAATIQYLHQSILDWGGYAENSAVGVSFCRLFPGGVIICAPSFVEFSLPQFNPALGTLREVDFAAQISLLGDVSTTGSGFFHRDSTATLGARAAIYFDSSYFGPDFGPLELSILHQAQCSTGVFIGSCSSDSGTFGDFTTKRDIFTGTSVTPFVGPGQINFHSGPNSYGVGLSHTDGTAPLNGGDSGILEANAPCDSVGECLVELAVAGYEVAVSQGVPAGCCEGFGSVHILRLVDIAYIYDPPAAVPEPSTLALLSIGLTALAIACGRRRRHARTNAARALYAIRVIAVLLVRPGQLWQGLLGRGRGSWAGPRPSLAAYVAGTGPRDEATAAGGRSCYLSWR